MGPTWPDPFTSQQLASRTQKRTRRRRGGGGRGGRGGGGGGILGAAGGYCHGVDGNGPALLITSNASHPVLIPRNYLF